MESACTVMASSCKSRSNRTPRRGATSKVRCCCFCARSTYSWWCTICSQKRRVQMATAQKVKKKHTTQKRATRRGMARGMVLRFRLRRTAVYMGRCSRVQAPLLKLRWYGSGLRQRRRARVRTRVGMDHLARLRLAQPELPGHAVDAAGLRQLCFREAQLAIGFAKLFERLLLALNVIRDFDCAEVLQAVDHDQC